MAWGLEGAMKYNTFCKFLDAMFHILARLWKRKMSFKGGVIIIGSLLWDNANRCEWRKRSLEDLETKIPVPLRIRYGRESGEQRCHTYTMIFSNHPTTGLGQGYIIGFNKKIENEEMLKEEAIALAKAEGIWTDRRPFFAKDWGAVGLLVNENKVGADLIKSIWVRLFQEYRYDRPRCRYDHLQYSIDDEPPVIDNNGFLHIDWTPEMNAFDFLIATPTAPKPRSALTAREIVERVIERNYRIYFDNNRATNITTFQDNEILRYLGG